MRLPRGGTCLFFLAGAALLWHGWRPSLPAPAFVLASCSLSPLTRAAIESHSLATPPGAPMCHSATLATLANGELLAIWYAGSQEADADVCLFQARFSQGQWSAPRRILWPEAVSEAEQRWTNKLGNPALYRDASGRLRLFFSVALGGWSSSSINQTVSEDGGATWSAPQRLITSPFFNLSTLARHPAVQLADGGFYLPVYHECARKFPELLRFDAAGRLLSRCRMDTQPGSLQPTLVPLDAQQALCYLRDYARGGHHVLCQRTEDAGGHWSSPAPLALLNKDTSVAAGRLADGTLLMAYNPMPAVLDWLVLAASRDGIDWQPVATLEKEPGGGPFAYPTLLTDGDRIDIVYTWRRQGIKHVRFNAAWVKEQLRDARD